MHTPTPTRHGYSTIYFFAGFFTTRDTKFSQWTQEYQSTQNYIGKDTKAFLWKAKKLLGS